MQGDSEGDTDADGTSNSSSSSGGGGGGGGWVNTFVNEEGFVRSFVASSGAGGESTDQELRSAPMVGSFYLHRQGPNLAGGPRNQRRHANPFPTSFPTLVFERFDPDAPADARRQRTVLRCGDSTSQHSSGAATPLSAPCQQSLSSLSSSSCPFSAPSLDAEPHSSRGAWASCPPPTPPPPPPPPPPHQQKQHYYHHHQLLQPQSTQFGEEYVVRRMPYRGGGESPYDSQVAPPVRGRDGIVQRGVHSSSKTPTPRPPDVLLACRTGIVDSGPCGGPGQAPDWFRVEDRLFRGKPKSLVLSRTLARFPWLSHSTSEELLNFLILLCQQGLLDRIHEELEAENPFLGSIPHPEGSQHSTRHPGPYIPRPLSSTSSSSSSSSWSSALSTRHGRWLPASWFRKALDVAPANMFIVDKDMRLRYSNHISLDCTASGCGTLSGSTTQCPPRITLKQMVHSPAQMRRIEDLFGRMALSSSSSSSDEDSGTAAGLSEPMAIRIDDQCGPGGTILGSSEMALCCIPSSTGDKNFGAVGNMRLVDLLSPPKLLAEWYGDEGHVDLSSDAVERMFVQHAFEHCAAPTIFCFARPPYRAVHFNSEAVLLLDPSAERMARPHGELSSFLDIFYPVEKGSREAIVCMLQDLIYGRVEFGVVRDVLLCPSLSFDPESAADCSSRGRNGRVVRCHLEANALHFPTVGSFLSAHQLANLRFFRPRASMIMIQLLEIPISAPVPRVGALEPVPRGMPPPPVFPFDPSSQEWLSRGACTGPLLGVQPLSPLGEEGDTVSPTTVESHSQADSSVGGEEVVVGPRIEAEHFLPQVPDIDPDPMDWEYEW